MVNFICIVIYLACCSNITRRSINSFICCMILNMSSSQSSSSALPQVSQSNMSLPDTVTDTRWVMCTVKCNQSSHTVNDKSFKGEKFRGLLGSSGMRGKVSQFFLSPPSYIHRFPNLQNSYERFNESFAFLTRILLKTVISIRTWKWTRVHYWQWHTYVQIPGWLCSYWKEEKSYSWSESEMKQIAKHFLVSFFCKLLPNLLAETKITLITLIWVGVTTVEYFSWCKLSAE